MKSDELKEKAEQAGELEELIKKAEDAEMLVYDLCQEIGYFDIQEPHGWLSTIIGDLRQELEDRLEMI